MASAFRGCQVTCKCSKWILKRLTDPKFRQYGGFFPPPYAEDDDECAVEAVLPHLSVRDKEFVHFMQILDKMREKITMLPRKKQGSICHPRIRLSAGTEDSVRDVWLNCLWVSVLLEYLYSSLLIILVSAKFAHMVVFLFLPHYLNVIISFITFQGFPSICWHPSCTCCCFVSGFYLLLKKRKLLSSVDLLCSLMRRP